MPAMAARRRKSCMTVCLRDSRVKGWGGVEGCRWEGFRKERAITGWRVYMCLLLPIGEGKRIDSFSPLTSSSPYLRPATHEVDTGSPHPLLQCIRCSTARQCAGSAQSI